MTKREPEFSNKIKGLLMKIRKIIRKNVYWDINFDFDSRYYRGHIIKDLFEIKKLIPKDAKILDFGCGRGILSALLSSMGYNNVFGIDKKVLQKIEGQMSTVLQFKLQRKIWKILEKHFNIKLLFYDGINIPFGNEVFDIVFAHAVIEHISPEYLPVLIADINRVLRPGGYLYISQTPRRQSLKENLGERLNLGGHEILVEENELKNLLQNKKFRIIKMTRTDLLPNLYILPKRIRPFWEMLYPIMSTLEVIAMKTPLNYFSTNIKLIARKENYI